MAPALQNISECQALVIDNNLVSRGILVSQLREYGIGKVTQCHRVLEARARLELTQFDFVLCEQRFGDDGYSGQALLDDLRRAQLLPFSTVFFMVTGEASYASVAEAAESALDGYLLKPFTAAALFERLNAARLRKAHLQPIFAAIEAQDFDRAAQLCLQCFDKRAPYWLYAARIGTELLLRLGRHDEAHALCKAVIRAKALPWAKLGVARVQIESGQTVKALSTLERLLGEDNGFADAYDVMGAAQVELGRFDEALETYRTAAELTPDSVVRLQKHGMMAYYLGDRATAGRVLARAATLGAGSKMFDPQSLVLLAFASFQDKDRKALDRCITDFQRLQERQPEDLRLQRFREVVGCLQLIHSRQVGAAVASVRALVATMRRPDFDFEAACNLAGLLSVLVSTSVELPDSTDWVRTLGLRYASSRGLGELLATACVAHAPHADLLRQCHLQINQMAEGAMALSLAGRPQDAVRSLQQAAQATLNGKLADLAQQVLARHRARIPDAATLQAGIAELRSNCGTPPRRATLTQDRRQPGGLTLRVATELPALSPAVG
ncbi:tetratricopeptide repeat protein [Xylophilus sp. GW821-FHT01B05]